MAVTLDTTPKSATGNAYATLAQANAYHEGRLHNSEWTAATDDQKNRALVMATRHLDQHVCWIGTRTTSTQALQWPRSGAPNRARDATLDADTYPAFLVEATAEQALFELRGERDAEPSGRGLSAVTLPGPLSIEFDRGQTTTQRVLGETVWKMIEPWALNRSPNPSALRMVGIAR